MAQVAARPVRKTVSVLFADVVGSTQLAERLDPEALQGVMTQYAGEMRRVIELYGGTVEKFIGDAVMAVFGVPVLHEDDALRAVMAALEMRAALAALNAELEREHGVQLQIRTGIHTGEVVSDPSAVDQALVAGDAVNAAARLEQAAPPGEILIGHATRQMVEGRVRLTRHRTLELRGLSQPVPTWRVRAVNAAAVEPAGSTPMVARRRELARLHARFERCRQRREGVFTAVTGPPGIGKSRLVRQFVSELGDSAGIAVGRCLPYGEGASVSPLREIASGLGGPGRLRDPAAQSILTAALGDDGAATAADVQWAVRALLEQSAAERPLVVVIDDIHWARPALLDLIEYLEGFLRGAPVLVIGLAREDPADPEPAWERALGRGRPIRLGPLSRASAARLARNSAARHGQGLSAARILDIADGNPLFIEQLVAVRAEPSAGTPPTIQALLASRIDGLPAAARRVAEAASVEGRGFHREAVAALVGEQDLDEGIAGLSQHELIRPARAELPGLTGYRFTHLLVRDAAYELLSKRSRCELHEQYAAWLEVASPSADDMIGYHLEQAHRYRADLGRADAEATLALGRRAGGHLRTAGSRARRSGDRPAASALFARAAGLEPGANAARAAVLIDLGAVERDLGRLNAAEAALGEALSIASDLEAPGLEARVQVERLLSRLHVDPDGVGRLAERQGDRLERALAGDGDDAGLAVLLHIYALLWWVRGLSAKAESTWDRSLAHARAAGEAEMAADVLGWQASSMLSGPTPAARAIARCRAIRSELAGDPRADALACHPLAALHAMRGEVPAARELLAHAEAVLAEFPVSLDSAVSHPQAYALLTIGDPTAAAVHLRAGRRVLTAMGERAVAVSTDSMLAEALERLGDARGAMRLTRSCEALASADDQAAQIQWRRVRSRLLGVRGRLAESEAFAAGAVAVAETTDWINDQALAHADHAVALRRLGRRDEAEAADDRAQRLFRQKGNVVEAEAAREAFAAARPAGRPHPARPSGRQAEKLGGGAIT